MHETYHQGVQIQIIAITRNQHLSWREASLRGFLYLWLQLDTECCWLYSWHFFLLWWWYSQCIFYLLVDFTLTLLMIDWMTWNSNRFWTWSQALVMFTHSNYHFSSSSCCHSHWLGNFIFFGSPININIFCLHWKMLKLKKNDINVTKKFSCKKIVTWNLIIEKY